MIKHTVCVRDKHDLFIFVLKDWLNVVQMITNLIFLL